MTYSQDCAKLCSPVIPRLWKLRGEALAALSRIEEAETTLQAAQEAAQAQGPRPLLWRIYVALGKLYQNQARQDEAEQAFATARTLIEELAVPIAEESLRDTFVQRALAMLPPTHPLSPKQAANM